MNLREQRGMELAATRTIQQKGGIWIVPSQAGSGTYRVHLMPKIASCTCPDHETRRVECKHIFAARFVMKREQNADGSVTVTKTVTFAEQRTTYPQAWSAYNEAQTNEQDKFQSLLHDLCSGLVSEAPKNGRPRRPSRMPCLISHSRFTAPFRSAVSCPI